jgi:hypothetical protein
MSAQAGATEPRWSHDGLAVYYRSAGQVVRVPVRDGGAGGTATTVVTASFDPNARGNSYAVAPDGRVLVKHAVTRDEPIIAVLNWLKALTPDAE